MLVGASMDGFFGVAAFGLVLEALCIFFAVNSGMFFAGTWREVFTRLYQLPSFWTAK